MRVRAGNAAGLVITASFSSDGQGHVRGPPITGITRRSTSFARDTFYRRLATTASTVTASCVACHTS